MVTNMRKITFNGGWGYENKDFIAKGWQDEPILVNGGACCKFYVRTTFYIGTHEELTKLWQNLVKNGSVVTAYQPKFVKNVNYCIEICKEDQFGRYDPAMCSIHKVNEVCWDFYKDITPFEQMKLNRQSLYLEWLQDHMAWEQCRKEVE